ncbi:uncharacterized protein BYT42DRAFT_579437 [Radiomyces spectabilis]|uniref:uncharacterized protein n=1 Tax=Radiomyces spectabilis TaxID=64574 RepID=UPI0022208559|nr:uncharacterized protein BYT42DRAFT_579437 [Radiomyces spectabilis]KAI8373168.1 hypothetical protein BYT42DRAFT_579437 [Radiomyces spectabilis]
MDAIHQSFAKEATHILETGIGARIARIQRVIEDHPIEASASSTNSNKRRMLNTGEIVRVTNNPSMEELMTAVREEAGYLLMYSKTVKGWCRSQTIHKANDSQNESSFSTVARDAPTSKEAMELEEIWCKVINKGTIDAEKYASNILDNLKHYLQDKDGQNRNQVDCEAPCPSMSSSIDDIIIIQWCAQLREMCSLYMTYWHSGLLLHKAHKN